MLWTNLSVLFFLVSWYLYLLPTAFSNWPLRWDLIFSLFTCDSPDFFCTWGQLYGGKWQFTWDRSDSICVFCKVVNPGKKWKYQGDGICLKKGRAIILWQLKSFKTTKDVTWSPSCKVMLNFPFPGWDVSSGSNSSSRFHQQNSDCKYLF